MAAAIRSETAPAMAPGQDRDSMTQDRQDKTMQRRPAIYSAILASYNRDRIPAAAIQASAGQARGIAKNNGARLKRTLKRILKALSKLLPKTLDKTF